MNWNMLFKNNVSLGWLDLIILPWWNYLHGISPFLSILLTSSVQKWGISMYDILTWMPNTWDFCINRLMDTITAIMWNKPKLTLKVCLKNESQEHNHWWVCSCAEAYSVLNISYTFILVWLAGYLQYQNVLFLWFRALRLVEMGRQARGKLCPWLWSSCWCSFQARSQGYTLIDPICPLL